MSRPLYRKAVVAVTLLALNAACAAFAQERHHAHQLRAVALVELYGPASKPTGGRLLPVFVLDRDKYYDAATYNATPRPLALDPGNVYEALDAYGVSAGFFTIGAAKQDKGDWYGLGQWKSAAEVKAAEAAAAARKKALDARGADTGPPKLKHGGSASATEKPEATSTKPAAPDDDRPQLKKPPEAKPSTNAEERPAVAPPKPEPLPIQSDPDRPTLRHGSGEQVKSTSLDYTPPAPVTTSGLKPRPGGPSAVYIAVSDPDGTGTLHPLSFPWKAEEEQKIRAKAIAVADAELNAYLNARRRAPAKGKKPAPAVHLVNPAVVSYDLLLDNNVVQVVSGESNGTHVLVITRTDLEFEPKKIFSAVTDKDHLDAVPRMELIGPVDAEGKGKAELLFRATYDDGFRYQLYKTGREQVWKLWESGLYVQ